MIPFNQTLIAKLRFVASEHPDYIALYVDGQHYTYAQLFELAETIAQQLIGYQSEQVVLLMDRSMAAYAGILACFLAGKVYVPLNHNDSILRLKKFYQLSGATLIFTDAAHEALAKILCGLTGQVLCVKDIQKNIQSFVVPAFVTPHAYLMFTSGSTGIPKAVMIDHVQLISFIENITVRTGVSCTDRCAQIMELSFDFSIYEIFACWFASASLYVFTQQNFLALASFIAAQEITFFACVPSTVLLLQQYQKLIHPHFPTLRYTVFCGEALTHALAKWWHQAAPHSVIDNLYGPTEATVALTGYHWTPDCPYEIVPIGHIFSKQKFKIDYSTSQNQGELLLSGSQVIQSYWPENTSNATHFINHDGAIWYKTGDLVSFDSAVGLLFVGRLDDQLKIRGYRVEKLEIELILKKIAQTEAVAVVAVQEAGVMQLHAYIAHSPFTLELLFEKYRAAMPNYTVPNKIWFIDTLPYNKNGKIDYQKLKMQKKLFPGLVDLAIYDAKRQKTINVAVWYPSHTVPKDHTYRKHYHDDVALAGEIAGSHYPLLLFSHGQMGHRFNQHYLATFLAEQGYIIASIEHADDAVATCHLNDHAAVLDRALDVQFCLEYLFHDPYWLHAIDRKKIALVGHSLGATTSIFFALAAARNNQFFHEENKISIEVHAMMLMAPAKAEFFTADSLQSLSLPVLLFTSGQDELLPEDAYFYADHLPNKQWVQFAEAGHFVYLMKCPEAVLAQCPEACVDIGTQRHLIHPLLQQHALRFFNECFN